MTALIEARSVSKRFRQHKRFPGLLGALKTLVTNEYTEVLAVSDIGFDIAAGEAVGYLGPNGAGKSTMIKMMTGILVPSAGTLSVLGRTPHLKRMDNACEIGVVFGQRSQLWWELALRHQQIPGRWRLVERTDLPGYQDACDNDLARTSRNAAVSFASTGEVDVPLAPPIGSAMWICRRSSMNSSQSGGPPSSRSCARMLSSSLTGRCRRPQAPIMAKTGTSWIAGSIRL
nr:ATP-binding cassette domain-containing protein [Rhizobium sp. WYCCWR10014]